MSRVIIFGLVMLVVAAVLGVGAWALRSRLSDQGDVGDMIDEVEQATTPTGQSISPTEPSADAEPDQEPGAVEAEEPKGEEFVPPEEFEITPAEISTAADFVESVRRVAPDEEVKFFDAEEWDAEVPPFVPFVEQGEWRAMRVLGIADEDRTWEDDMLARRNRIRGFCCSIGVLNTSEPMTMMAIVHEMTHSADSKLHSGGGGPSAEELAPLQSAPWEGNANRVMLAYRDTLPPDVQEFVNSQLPIFGPEQAGLVSPGVGHVVSFGYDEGSRFVQAIAAEGGEEAVDAMLDAWPATSEQVMFPEKYLAGEPAVEVPYFELPAGVEEIDRRSVGAFALFLVLEAELGQDAAMDLVEGWAGDSYILWTEGGQDCLHLSVEMDTEAGAAEVAGVFGVEADGTRVDYEHCLPSL